MPGPIQSPKILLVAPTSNSLLQREGRSTVAPHYGLNLIRAALQNSEVDATILDEFSIQNNPIYEDTNSWEKALTTALSTYPSLRVIGFTVLTNFRKEVANLSRLTREIRSDLTIVWGGPHVTALGPKLMERYQDLCDLMVSGPTDNQIIKYLKELVKTNHKEPTPLFLRGDLNKDIAHFIHPNYSSLQNLHHRIPRLIIRTSSGCPTPTCTFCSAMFEGPYSPKSINQASLQIRDALTVNPVRLEFHDQDFFYNLNNFRSLVSGTTFEGVETVYCHSGIESLTHEHIQIIEKTKPKWEVFVGLESASERIYRALCKQRIGPQSLDRFIEHSSQVNNQKIRFGIFVLLGVPGEQEEDYKITEGYLHRLENVDLHIGLMKVFPGTILERQLIKKGNLDPELWLDENGPQVVSAVNGDAFVKASEQWQHLLDAFPSSREHNKIDQELFHLNFFEPENCGR